MLVKKRSKFKVKAKILLNSSKFQSRNGKTEKFYLFFPINNVEILPRFKEAYKSKNIYEILRVNLILLIPIIFGVLWVILSALGVIPPLESTLF